MRRVVIDVPPELDHLTPGELTELLSYKTSSGSYHLMTYEELQRERTRLHLEKPKDYESLAGRIGMMLRRWGRI